VAEVKTARDGVSGAIGSPTRVYLSIESGTRKSRREDLVAGCPVFGMELDAKKKNPALSRIQLSYAHRAEGGILSWCGSPKCGLYKET